MGKRKTFKSRIVTIFGVVAALLAFVLTVLQLKDYFIDEDEAIEIFAHDIFFTYPNNYRLIEFLKTSEDKIIYISSRVDSSVSINVQAQLEEKCGHGDAVLSGKVFNTYLSVPYFSDSDFNPILEISEPLVDEESYELNSKIGCGYYKLYIEKDGDKGLMASHGGTGLITFNLKGFYRVDIKYMSGPSVVFHLIEYDAPVDLRSKYLLEAKKKRKNLIENGEVFDPES